MNKSAIKDFLYGGLEELLKNREYYYESSVGGNYSHLTDRGREMVCELLDIVAHKIREAEEQDLNDRAKKMVMDGLTK